MKREVNPADGGGGGPGRSPASYEEPCMFLHIEQVLTPEELERLHGLCQEAPFVDGKLTAGAYAKVVKENQQLQGDSKLPTD